MKQLQILTLGFLNNSEFSHLKTKKKNPLVCLSTCSYCRFLNTNISLTYVASYPVVKIYVWLGLWKTSGLKAINKISVRKLETELPSNA